MIRVVIPIHHSRRWIDDCIDSVLGQEDVELSVCVVDNASQDGSTQAVRTRWPEVTVVELDQNHGYGAAINRGALASGEGHVLALNVDTRLHPGCVRILLKTLEEGPLLGAVAPRVLASNGQVQPTAHRFPTLPRLTAEAVGADRLPRLGPRLGYHLPMPARDRIPVDWATGVALLIRDDAWREIGGFDPAYFFFAEELDLQWRLHRANWRVEIVDRAVLTHHGGKRPIPATRFVHSHDGMERFFAKRGGRRAGLAARAILLVLAASRAIAWTAIGLLSPRRRAEAARWRTMFTETFAVSVRRLIGR
jgi:GT2 family glycosyltransferase